MCTLAPVRSAFAQSSATFPDVSAPPPQAPKTEPKPATDAPSWNNAARAVPEERTAGPNSWNNSTAAVPDAPPAAAPTQPLDLRPPLLPYREGMPVPEGYVVQTRANSGLIAGGLVGLAITYVTGVVIATGEDFGNGTTWALVPVVGPWGAIGARTYTCRANDIPAAKQCVKAAVGEVRTVTFLAVDGIGQMASAVVLLAGLLSSTDELVRQDLVKVSVGVPEARGEPWSLTFRGTF